jgi:NADH-quinone oxidoreductase subunit I
MQWAGFGVTFRTIFRKTFTQGYPEKGKEKVTAAPLPRPAPAQPLAPTASRSASAASCARGPARRTRSSSRARQHPRERYSPGERYGRVYQINYLRCIGCGLCIEACPTRALTMTNEFEARRQQPAEAHLREAGPSRPVAAGDGGAAARHGGRCHEKDYYEGRVTGVR